MTLALVLLLACQEDVYIRKIDKVRYIEAAASCREAEAKLESEETFAIEKLTRILSDSAITEVECNLRIQVSDIYGPPYLFLPYQYRARARMSLAAKTPDVLEFLDELGGYCDCEIILNAEDQILGVDREAS